MEPVNFAIRLSTDVDNRRASVMAGLQVSGFPADNFDLSSGGSPPAASELRVRDRTSMPGRSGRRRSRRLPCYGQFNDG